MPDAMTARERWLGALQGEPLDRLPFWAKLDGAYPRNQAAPFSGWSLPELHAWMGSEPHGGVADCLREVRTCTAREVTRADGQMVTDFVGPCGTLRRVDEWDEASQSWHPTSFPLRTRADVELLTDWYADARVELDEAALERARANAAAPTACLATGIGISPLMDFLQHLAGIAQGHYLLADCPGAVAGLFAAMHAGLRQRAELIGATTPADLIYMVENTSTTLLSPAQFRQYVLPYLRDYTALAQAHGRMVVLHMCGHLRDLLADLDTLPVAAFEAFTSPPVGNTPLAVGRAACPRKCLLGGTNAALWLRPAEEIIATLARDLDALPHHRGLIVSSAGVMPPRATPPTIKAVADWLAAYPARW